MDQTNTIVKEFYDALPQGTKTFIADQSWRKGVQNIAKKYGLDSDQEENIEFQTFLILIALAHPSEFEENIASQANLPTALAHSITTDMYSIIPTSMLDYSADLVEELEKNKSNTSQAQETEVTQDARQSILNEIENPHPSEMKTVMTPRAAIPATPTTAVNPQAPINSSVPGNLPTVPEHHELMKYYSGTEPIVTEQIDYSGPIPLKKKDQPKLTDTPKYYPGTDPYRESSK